METGADLVIVNRFGKRERDGKGLARVIERALDADIPVVIAVSSESFSDWIKFADGMSVSTDQNCPYGSNIGTTPSRFLKIRHSRPAAVCVRSPLC